MFLVFCVWLVSLHMTSISIILVITHSVLFFLVANTQLYFFAVFFSLLSRDRHLTGFYVYNYVLIFNLYVNFFKFGYILISGSAESQGTSIFMSLKYGHMIFHNIYCNLIFQSKACFFFVSPTTYPFIFKYLIIL